MVLSCLLLFGLGVVGVVEIFIFNFTYRLIFLLLLLQMNNWPHFNIIIIILKDF